MRTCGARSPEVGGEDVDVGADGIAVVVGRFFRDDDALGIFERERAEEDAMEEGEDGGVRADPEGEGEDDDGGVAGRFEEGAEGEFHDCRGAAEDCR